jgi:AraC-like DNA-binding protein
MQAADFVESYISAWNRNDPERVANHLAADGIYHDIPANIQRTHDELIVSLNDFFAEFPHHYEQIGDVVSNQNTIAFQYRVCPVRGPGRKRLASYCGAEFISLDGDAAITIADYYDFPTAIQKDKYAKSGLQRRQMQELKSRLEQIMVTEKAYLKPNLTLPLLAEAVGCSVNHLSQVINAGFNMSFFDYLNNHRIAHARTLLSELNSNGGAVLNIAFSVGFNSNSAFYAAFKKHVGMTPAQYRKASAVNSSA